MLTNVLAQLAGKVHVLANPGNRGDGVIVLGQRTLLATAGIDYTMVQAYEDIAGDVLLTSGCGAFSKAYHHMVDFIRFYYDRFKRIIILPASFDTDCPQVAEFLTSLPPHVTVCCREKVSYFNVLNAVPCKENVLLEHDLAFLVDYTPWFRKGEGTLVAFRTDEEAVVGITPPAGNRDVSCGTQAEGKQFLEEISRYGTVYTNRAHVAIAAAMLGKTTHVFPSVYFKQKAIYEYSLSRMPHVHWHEHFEQ